MKISYETLLQSLALAVVDLTEAERKAGYTRPSARLDQLTKVTDWLSESYMRDGKRVELTIVD